MLTIIGILIALNAAAFLVREAAAAGQRHELDQWRALDSDLHLAIKWSGNRWGVSPEWLHACAHDEGGHGRFIDNKPYMKTDVPRIYGTRYDGDGWFQYLTGTWEWMSNAAWKAARGGERPPGAYRRIDSKLGQAFTTAWAFRNGYAYHWHGAAC